MHAFNVAASLSFSQTVCGGTGSSYSPFMVIAITGDSFARGLFWLSLTYPLSASRSG
jgi:hypothetical protein